jgi:zinc protease
MIDYQRFILANGLCVITHEDNATPIVAVNLLYNVGSRDENPERTGFAHLFEHLMFSGSKNAPDYDVPIQQAGGDNNAFTNNDMTNFYVTAPAENLETLLWLESDRMLALKVNAKNLKTQRKVVVEEFKETTLNEPYGDVWHHIGDMAFKKHPYRWPVIGLVPQHIEDATLEDVKNFYEAHYVPSNAILTVAGNFSKIEGGTEGVKKLVEKWFGDIPAGQTPARQLPQEPPQTEQVRRTVEAAVPLDALYLVFHSPERMHPDYYAVDLMTDILSSGASSRFYQKLLKEKRLFSEIDCYQTGNLDPGIVVVEGKPTEGVSLETAEAAIWEELAIIQNELVSEKELQKQQNRLESQQIFGDLGALNKAMNITFYELMGDASLINSDVNKYLSVTRADIQRVSQEIFKPENSSVLYYKAKKQAE